ncbi:DUF3106 domain-containing protein [Burkholderiaceae bacterium FT117]|uniref:DUF3106 domain-containing protein n=1 Tax=Zeimonas sediminis TaxID=2944268 RepID=UPI0023430631|nr:DUF3106 domain-containing protein [Zeimonas sediminis]MCM5572062.1 DUF3106 domain-containing protein [Zeimonas sediminis]
MQRSIRFAIGLLVAAWSFAAAPGAPAATETAEPAPTVEPVAAEPAKASDSIDAAASPQAAAPSGDAPPIGAAAADGAAPSAEAPPAQAAEASGEIHPAQMAEPAGEAGPTLASEPPEAGEPALAAEPAAEGEASAAAKDSGDGEPAQAAESTEEPAPAHANGPTEYVEPQPVARPAERTLRRGLSASPASRPLWSDLSASQRQVLAPFEAQWNDWPAAEKRRWQTLADRIPRMSAESQARARERIAEWAALTPAQQRLALRNYRMARQLPPDERKALWERYTQMTPEQQQVLRASGWTSNTAARHAGARTGLAKEAAQPLAPALPGPGHAN